MDGKLDDLKGTGTGSEAGAAAPAAATPLRAGGKEYASVEELIKAHDSVNSELGRWTSKYGDLEKQALQDRQRLDTWDQWWRAYQPVWGEDVQALLQKKFLALTGGNGAESPSPKPASAASDTQWETYEGLTPKEQGLRIRQAVIDDLNQQFGSWRTQLEQRIAKQFSDKEQWYQQYLTQHLSLMRRALEQKLKNPNFDVDAVMEHAVRALSGQMDPIELGQQILAASTYQQQLEQTRKDAYAQGKKDWEEEQKNKHVETVPPGGLVPKFKMPSAPLGTRQGLATLRERAAEAMLKKGGPGVFLGE